LPLIRINLNKMLRNIIICGLCGVAGIVNGQSLNDTSKNHIEYLAEISLVGQQSKRDVLPSPEIVGTKINAGKKNAIIVLDNLNTIVVNNNMRQILAKVPGMHIWESDGSGIQIGISTRGLSPNRSWEFNIRQNGADIAADPYGYPEAYYNPPMQAIQRIQIIKGAGALQFGPQFGGMINYIMRDGKSEAKPIAVQTAQTIGSFGLYNNFLAVSGRKNNFYYYAFYDRRSAEGFRKNSAYNTQTLYFSGGYQFTKNTDIAFDFTNYDMLSQQPGGLTDADMSGDITKSTRFRNWFSTPWFTGNIKFNWKINNNQTLQIMAFGMDADRKSVGFTKSIDIPDTIKIKTLQYAPRELAIDKYHNRGIEASYLLNYYIANQKQTFTAGIRYFSSFTERFQKGVGSSGTDQNFNTDFVFPGEFNFNTKNYSVFAEQVFRVSKKLLLIPGVRYENIHSVASGRSGFNTDGTAINIVAPAQIRNFFIGGFGLEYHLSNGLEIYGNVNQAYRPILFSDMQAVPGTEVIDANLKDASGINSDIGIRGLIGKWFYLDAGVFALQYNNRTGRLSMYDANNQAYTLKTNVGNSFTAGLEALVEIDPMAHTSFKKKFRMPLFVSYSFNDARYQDFNLSVKNGAGLNESKNINNNFIENAPRNILRTGINFGYLDDKTNQELFNIGFQYSYVGQTFNDALNTVELSVNAQNGIIPEYSICDLNMKVNLKKDISIKIAVNNLTNAKYFTRRAGGYPGPGVMPSDGRAILFTLDVKI
jgi:Fe(3+) dicitrate transport protein